MKTNQRDISINEWAVNRLVNLPKKAKFLTVLTENNHNNYIQS